MQHKLPKTLSFLVLLTLIGHGAQGLAQASSPVAPPAPTEPAQPIKGQDEKGFCTLDFLKTYLNVSNQVATVATYVKANETPPNLKEADEACTTIATEYPLTSCTVTTSNAKASTSDYAAACAVIHQLYNTQGGSAAPSEPAVIDDSTPLMRVPVKGLSFKIVDLATVKNAIDKAKSTFVISGKLLDFADSIMVDSPIRCTFVKGNAGSKFSVSQDEILKVEQSAETIISGARYSRLTFIEKDFAIDCSSRTGNQLTLGEFKTAFAGLLEITYTK